MIVETDRFKEIFKAYDIRGRVPDQLDERTSQAIGWGFARFADQETLQKRILVAHDMRTSSVELAAAFIKGVRAAGGSVVDLGMTSSDMIYFASGWLDSPGAMFTASHNPAQYNGIKLCLAGAKPIGANSGLEAIRQYAAQAVDSGADLGPVIGSVERHDLLEHYASHVRSFVDAPSIRPLTVVTDTANGMGGLVVPKVFEGLNCELIMLYPELDGTFPNHPANPIQPENLVDLKAAVLDHGADIGLAFDGDADRVFLVDEHAEALSGSLTTALIAHAMLERHPGSTILYNLICSKAVPEIIEGDGGKAVRTRVGHSFIKQVMAETGAVFGGEHSGHYYFRDNYRADSGMIAALVVLEAMSRSDTPLSQMVAPYQHYADSGEINMKVADPLDATAQLASQFAVRGAVVDYMDGITIENGDWWFNLRPSNTEPLLRLNLEARTPLECAVHVKEVLDTLSGLVACERVA